MGLLMIVVAAAATRRRLLRLERYQRFGYIALYLPLRLSWATGLVIAAVVVSLLVAVGAVVLALVRIVAAITTRLDPFRQVNRDGLQSCQKGCPVHGRNGLRQFGSMRRRLQHRLFPRTAGAVFHVMQRYTDT